MQTEEAQTEEQTEEQGKKGTHKIFVQLNAGKPA